MISSICVCPSVSYVFFFSFFFLSLRTSFFVPSVISSHILFNAAKSALFVPTVCINTLPKYSQLTMSSINYFLFRKRQLLDFKIILLVSLNHIMNRSIFLPLDSSIFSNFVLEFELSSKWYLNYRYHSILTLKSFCSVVFK